MDKFIILTDVTSDLNSEIRNYFSITDYVHGYVHIDDRNIKTTLDWEGISKEEFYSLLSDKRVSVSTAPASPDEYYEKFRSYASMGYDILSISISSKISSTFSVAERSAQRVLEEYPDRKIYCFDSQRMSASMGLLTAYAQEMQNNGKSMDEIIVWLEENKCRIHQMGPIDDLMFVARRGRISTGKAIMGSFAGVKPMGDCNNDGYVTVLAKAKGIKKALAATIEYVKRVGNDLENQYIFIAHSNRDEYALKLKEQLEKSITAKRIFITDVFSASGTNIGPGMIGVYFLGDPVSENCEAEKEALTHIFKECF